MPSNSYLSMNEDHHAYFNNCWACATILEIGPLSFTHV